MALKMCCDLLQFIHNVVVLIETDAVISVTVYLAVSQSKWRNSPYKRTFYDFDEDESQFEDKCLQDCVRYQKSNLKSVWTL